jgi:cytochrome b561
MIARVIVENQEGPMSAIEVHRYNRLSILLHWLTALLFVAVYATIELREIFPKGSVPREAMKSAHFMLGLSIFALAWLRVAGRLVWPAPRVEPPPARRRRAHERAGSMRARTKSRSR